ncbi:MAG: hypothetical protein KJN70_13430 [Eudoraea sp.]|nr:hypothetical protein [Eudoraea sp.]
MENNLKYPSNAEFAFTILDDTDDTTVANGRPVYDFLNELGLRTTKTVWSFDTEPENQGPYFAGETLSSPEYLKWVHQLAANDFEIAFHNATMGTSLRQDTIKALNLLKNEFGHDVRLHCNHGQNRENLHWGADRYSSYIIKKALGFISILHSYPEFEGNNPESHYYWSDIADKHLSYIRAFTFRRLNGARIPPGRPYLDSAKQNSTLFFNTTDAPDVSTFNKLVNPSTIDKLRKQNGWSIVTTHLGKGFYWNNKLNPEFKENMEYIATLPGWFAPASRLLDYLKKELGASELSAVERFTMEYSHVLDRIKGRLFDQSFY